MPDVKDDLRTFLRDNFDDTAVSVPFTNDDDIVFADYDGAREYPQVAIVSRDPVVTGGGQTGATGIDPSGAGPVQDVVYLVQVDCWGGPEDEQVYQDTGYGNGYSLAYASVTHADTVAVQLAEEVAATCRVGSDGAPDGYEWLMADPPQEADDTEESPTHHREIVTVRMKVTYTP